MIAEIGASFGAQVPFLRPKEIADDMAALIDVVRQGYAFYSTEQDLRRCAVPAADGPLHQIVDGHRSY